MINVQNDFLTSNSESEENQSSTGPRFIKRSFKKIKFQNIFIDCLIDIHTFEVISQN